MNYLFELFKNSITMPEDYTDFIWIGGDENITWNTDNDIEDLYAGDGDTYSQEIYRGSRIIEGHYMLILLDDGCGDKYQAIFDLNKEVKDPS